MFRYTYLYTNSEGKTRWSDKLLSSRNDAVFLTLLTAFERKTVREIRIFELDTKQLIPEERLIVTFSTLEKLLSAQGLNKLPINESNT